MAQFGSDGSISSLRRRGGALGFPLLSAAFVRSSALGAVRKRVGEERHKALLVLLFNVYFTGSELSALPVTPSEGPSQGVWMSAEAYRVVARSLRRYSWSSNAFGVFWQCTPQTMTQPIT